MNREDIIRMAREAGIDEFGSLDERLILFAALVAALEQPEQPQEATHLRDLLKRIRQWDALDIPDSDGAYWKREIDAALEQPVQEPLSDEELDRLWREPMSADWEHREFARAIEAAHGIKENT
jgi:hypothetical protein